MAEITHNAKLNELVVDLGRSLLQYAAESGTWSRSHAAASDILALAVRQQRSVAQLADLLIDRGATVDFGGFPTDYTDLHFMSLDYFLPRLQESEDALVSELDEAVHTCVDDAEAVALLQGLLAEERAIATALRALTSPALAAAR